MRQILLSKSGSVLVEEVPDPSVGSGEVLIDVAWSVISTGTETSSLAPQDLRGRMATAVKLAQLGAERLRTAGLEETLRKARVRDGIQSPTGYSVAGTVRGLGPEVGDLAIGDEVAAGGSDYAHHAERVSVPRNLVVRIPDGVPLRSASFATVGAIALQGVRRAAPQIGEVVVVVGLGLVGQLAAQILGASGCRVIGVDPRRDRIELALRGPHGLAASSEGDPDDVERRVLAETSGAGADAVLLCAGTASSEPANLALRVVRQRGRVVVVGAVGMELERGAFYRKEVEFTISCSYGPGRYDPTYEEGGLDYPRGFVRWTENRNFGAFLELVAAGVVDPEILLGSEHDMTDARAAFEAAKRGSGAGVAHLLRYPAAEARTPVRRTVRRSGTARLSSDGEIGVAVIGAGGFASSTLLPALAAQRELALRAIVSRTGASAARVAEEFRVPVASTDPDEILAAPDVDAVVIATRHDSHARLARAALAAGKHVFLEKPMAIGRGELDALRDEAASSELIFTVGYNRRYAPLVHRVRDILTASPGPGTAVYRVSAGKNPPGHWTLDPSVGGGRVIGEACHMLDLLAFLFGPDVVAWHATGLAPAGAHASASPEDFVVAMRLRNPDGSEYAVTLLYTSLGSGALGKEHIEVHTGGGSIVLDDFERLEVHGLPGRGETLRTADKGHRAQIGAFVAALRGRPSDLLGDEEAWRAADLALRIDGALRDERRDLALQD